MARRSPHAAFCVHIPTLLVSVTFAILISTHQAHAASCNPRSSRETCGLSQLQTATVMHSIPVEPDVDQGYDASFDDPPYDDPNITNQTSVQEQSLFQNLPDLGLVQEQPTEPTLCTPENMGRCECGTDPIKTYTWWIDGVQRCTSIFFPELAPKPMPVILFSNCYGKDKLNKFTGKIDSIVKGYGIAMVYLSSPSGYWETGNDHIANDTAPQPCALSDTPEMPYVQGIFDLLEKDPDTFDLNKIYTYGFSQNAMMSAYVGFCFSEQVAGVVQFASGLVDKDVTAPVPNKGGYCRLSDYLAEQGRCVTDTPCPECKYWPIYPCSSKTKTVPWCGMAYDNDPYVTTMETMYRAASNEGFDARLLLFPSSDLQGGHRWPKSAMQWALSCLGVNSFSCSPACEEDVKTCKNARETDLGDLPWDAYSICTNPSLQHRPASCPANCTPPLSMLALSEGPKMRLSDGRFGRAVEWPLQRPKESKCQHRARNCTSSCEFEFVKKCVKVHSKKRMRADAYHLCRSQLDVRYYRLQTAGCKPGCSDTPMMLEARADMTISDKAVENGVATCSPECESYFVNTCVEYWNTAQRAAKWTSFWKCREMLDASEFSDCVAKCGSTPAMLAIVE